MFYVAWEASRGRIGVVELGIVEDLNQVTAMERTLRAGARREKTDCQLEITEFLPSVARVISSGQLSQGLRMESRVKRFGNTGVWLQTCLQYKHAVNVAISRF